ncbi:ABC transporter substrate-binding protein [Paenibacillus marinisediminis]
MIRSILRIICLLATITLVTACSQEAPTFDKNEKLTLNIGYVNESHFNLRYKDLLEKEFPNIRFNVVSTIPLNNLEISPSQLIKENPLDLIAISPRIYPTFINEGLLLDIEPLILKDNIDLSVYLPSAIDEIRYYGNGKLFGLAPSFFGKALVYNKELFDKFKIDIPKNDMNWDELLQLASRFKSPDDSLQGDLKGITLPFDSKFEFIVNVGKTEGLRVYDEKERRAHINDKSWIPIWEDIMSAFKQDSIDLNNNLNTYITPFVDGQRALMQVSYEEYRMLENRDLPFEWSSISMPVSHHAPDRSGSLVIVDIYSIANESKQKEAAWEVLKFLNSDKAASWDYRSQFGFSTLSSFVTTKETDRSKLEAFYSRSYKPTYYDYPPSELISIGEEYINDILSGKLNVEEGIQALQIKADQVISNYNGG